MERGHGAVGQLAGSDRLVRRDSRIGTVTAVPTTLSWWASWKYSGYSSGPPNSTAPVNAVVTVAAV